jgi:Flp pilus assembly protein TadD
VFANAHRPALLRRCSLALALWTLAGALGCDPPIVRRDPRVAAYRAALAANPKDVDTLYNLALRLFQSNKFSEAIEALQRRLKLLPDDPESLYLLGLCYHNLGQLSDATAVYRHLVLVDGAMADRLFEALY